MIRRTFRWLLGTVGVLAILLALTIVAARIVLTQIPERREDLQALVNRTTGLDLRLGELSARWGPAGPEIYAKDVEIYAPDGGPRLARAASVSISTDLKRVITRGQLKSARVRLIGPEVRLVRTVTGLELEGQSQIPKRPDKGPMNSDALPSGSLRIEDGRITVIDVRPKEGVAAAPPEVLLRLQGLNLNLQRDRDLLWFAGALNLPGRMQGELKFNGSTRGRLDQPRLLGWRLDAEGREVKLDHWAGFLSGRWRGLNPRGQLEAFTLAMSGSGKQSPRFKVAGRFSGLGIDPVDRVPGLRGLAGDVRATEKGGEARVSAVGFVLDMPYRFRDPLTVDTARGLVSWSRPETGGWRIVAREAQAESAHGSAVADMELTMPPGDSSRILKLNAKVRNADVREVRRYLPIDRLRNPKTLEWLDAAFVAGRAVNATLKFDGPTRSFPFRNGEGEFLVTCSVEDATLHYGKDWPDLEHITAEVEFRNAGLSATVLAGEAGGMQLMPGGRAQIADLREVELTVSATAKGDLGAGLGFMQRSPLGAILGRNFRDLRGAGAFSAQLDLFLPIKHMADRKYTVVADLGAGRGGSRLGLTGTQHELRALRGRLTVADRKLTARGIRATYLGGPVTIDLKPSADDNVVYAQGRTSAVALAQVFGVPEKVALDGTLDWKAVTRVTPGTQDKGNSKPMSVAVQIDSTLEGLAVNLPAPLNKSASEGRALSVLLRWPQPDVLQVGGMYGGLTQAQLSFERRLAADGVTQSWVLDRGTVRLGGGRARMPNTAGLAIAGNVDALDLAGWLAMRSGKSGGRPLSDYLRSVDVSAREARLYGFRLPDVAVSMVGGAQAWSVNVSGPRSQGTVLVPFDLSGSDPVFITMAKLDLGEPQSAGGGAREEGSGTDPRRWPAVKVSVRDFSAWNKHLGALTADLVRTRDGLALQSMTARGSSFVLTGSGAWTATATAQSSRLALRLESTDVLDSLQRLGYGTSLTGKRGLVVMNLNWPGAPDGQLMGRLSGGVQVEIDNGQLIGVQPGAGRVFGLMSIATLRRRLALDFSDLTDKGLAFDSIRGDFTLKEGDAYTSNLLLQGPAAEIGVVGRTGLDARDYDQTAVVTGNFGSSLPVAGALAGGPVVGAALLVFSQIFKQPLKGVARGYYRITGPWDDPTVERVEAEDLKKAEGAARDVQEKAGRG